MLLEAHPVLLEGPFDSAAARSDGPAVALMLAGVCLAAGGLYAVLSTLAPARLSVPRGVSRAALAVAGVLLVAGVIAADPAERLDAFKAPPAGATDPGFIRSHLLSGGGSGRWQFWSAAVDQFQAHPVAGGGAGSYEAWWAEHGSLAYFVRNAHSLWLETLGELGLAGAVLLLAAFGIGLGSAAAPAAVGR